jgi:hypothetical protein
MDLVVHCSVLTTKNSFQALAQPREQKRDRIELAILVPKDFLARIDPKALTEKFKTTLKNRNQKPEKKVTVRFEALQS